MLIPDETLTIKNPNQLNGLTLLDETLLNSYFPTLTDHSFIIACNCMRLFLSFVVLWVIDHYLGLLFDDMCLSKLVRPDLLDSQTVDFDFDLEWDKCDYFNKPTFSKSDRLNQDLNIVHWNIRGLNSKIDSLKSFLEYDTKGSVGVVSLNETWISKQNEKYCTFPNYDLRWWCRVSCTY